MTAGAVEWSTDASRSLVAHPTCWKAQRMSAGVHALMTLATAAASSVGTPLVSSLVSRLLIADTAAADTERPGDVHSGLHNEHETRHVPPLRHVSTVSTCSTHRVGDVGWGMRYATAVAGSVGGACTAVTSRTGLSCRLGS